MDSYCTGSIVEQIKTGPVHVFRAWEERWEKKQFNKKGDSRHAVWVSAKYGGLKYYESDNPDQIGVFPEYDSAILTRAPRLLRVQDVLLVKVGFILFLKCMLDLILN